MWWQIVSFWQSFMDLQLQLQLHSDYSSHEYQCREVQFTSQESKLRTLCFICIINLMNPSSQASLYEASCHTILSITLMSSNGSARVSGGRPLDPRESRHCGPHCPRLSLSQAPSTSPSSLVLAHLHVCAVIVLWNRADTPDRRLLSELKLLAGRV